MRHQAAIGIYDLHRLTETPLPYSDLHGNSPTARPPAWSCPPNSMLYVVGMSDPLTFVAMTLLWASVAWLACWIPARRAIKIDPTIDLRYE